MSASDRCLYLFSSNESRLYAQDILNVMGAPKGHPYTFRYDAKRLPGELKNRWESLQDMPTLVVFSLQQHARFQSPAFIPIRGGYVLGTHREGDSYFVKFRLGEYVGLTDDPSKPHEKGDRVARFTKRLEETTETPYSFYASQGRQLSEQDVDITGESSVLFSRIGSYLAQTATFQEARFVRILGIRPTTASSEDPSAYIETYPADPVYKLRAHTSYELVLFHSQPDAPPRPAPFKVFVDGSTLRTLGTGQFNIASRYDEVTIRVATASPTGLEIHETAIVLEPEDGVQGPVVKLDVSVEANRGKAIGIASSQAVALIFVALAGVLSSLPLGWRIGLAVVGALTAVGLGLVGAAPLRPPALPSAPAPVSHTTGH